MHRTTKRGATVVAVAALATGLGAGVAQARTEVVVRPADLVTTDTRATGHVDVLPYGVHVWTEGATSTDKAAGYFAVDLPLAEVTTASMTWFGTDARPGQQLVVDADGDAATTDDRGILVGEKVYGDDWWLANSAAQVLKDGAPSHEGGSGSTNHGTLAQWGTAFPDARAIGAGFSLGSGVKGDGVVASMTLGETDYVFTDEAAPEPPVEPTVVDVTGSHVREVAKRSVRIEFSSAVQPEGTVMGERLAWQVKVDGAVAFSTRQGFGDTDVWATRFQPRSGRHHVTIYKNKVLLRTLTFVA